MRNSETCRSLVVVILSLCCATSLSLAAAPQGDDGGARLRAALRTATAQVRDLQDQNAALVAKQSEAERDRMALAQKLVEDERVLDALRKQVQAGDAASLQVNAQLEAQKANLTASDAAYRDNLTKWQAAYNEAADSARARDAEAMRLDGLLMQSLGRSQACEAKNMELYKLGKEVLDVYDRQDLLASLSAREPFTKLKRVQLENLIQDYEDKLRANAIAHPAQ
jgi:hypothetical protein